MSTLVLKRSEIVQLVDPGALAETMRNAFRDYSQERVIPGRRFFSPLSGPGDAMILAPGLVAGIPAYTVKVHAKFPQQTPAIRGALLLNDLQTGALLAVMDSTYITAMRTGLGAAIATDILARPDAATVAVIGAGTQGRFQLRYLSQLRQIDRVTVYDLSAERARTYVEEMQFELSLEVAVAETLAAALAEADIVLSATWSIEPFLFPDLIRAGCHITTLGADQPGEAEVSADLIKQALFVCDDRDLTTEMGAIGGAGLESDWIDAELGEVIAGTRPGRSSPEQITLYGAVGVAFQDLVAAWQVYRSARRQGVGHSIDLLS